MVTKRSKTGKKPASNDESAEPIVVMVSPSDVLDTGGDGGGEDNDDDDYTGYYTVISPAPPPDKDTMVAGDVENANDNTTDKDSDITISDSEHNCNNGENTEDVDARRNSMADLDFDDKANKEGPRPLLVIVRNCIFLRKLNFCIAGMQL